jgi:ABC-2 type transport system permease protein
MRLVLQALVSSFRIGRKGTVIWDSPDMLTFQIVLLPFLQMSFFALLAKYLNYTSTSISLLVISNALQSASYTSVFAVASVTTQDKRQGTLQSFILTPASRIVVLIGKSGSLLILSLVVAVSGLTYAGVIFGASFANTDLVAVAVIVILTSVSMTGLGIMISSLGLFLRDTTVVSNVFLSLTLIFCGVNFPVSLLPYGLSLVSYSIPLTFGVTALREVITGAQISQLLPLLGLEFFEGVLLILLAYLMWETFERMAVKGGVLEQY